MKAILSKSLWLLFFAVVICCVLYPAALWGIGQLAFSFQANGSMVNGPDGQPVGSLLIAQPFTKDEYFQPRPSAASYDASASASSSLAASNYALRNRVAGTLGPIVKYQSGPKAGQLVGPDVEAWFQQDRFHGSPHLVAQWADTHNSAAQTWVSTDPTHASYVDEWAKKHPDAVAQFIKDNPATPQPKAGDLAMVFFESFSKEHPGMFPAAAPAATASAPGATSATGGTPVPQAPATVIAPVKEGADIQAAFFDLWRQEHPNEELANVPGDLVMSSASGLDPHITLENALFQLDRVAAKWAANTKRDPAVVHKEIEQILQDHSAAPLGGLAGEKIINVLEVNLELRKQYGAPS